MSFYDPSYYSIYDLIDSLNNSRRVQPQQLPLPQQYYPQQYVHPVYPGYRTARPPPQQPYYYFNAPRNEQESIGDDEYDDDDDIDVDDESELSPRDALYRSLYGDGPYRSIRPSSKSASSSNSVYKQSQQQRPPIKRQPSYPRAPHPAESVVNLLNLLGANIPYPDQEQLPTIKTIHHEASSGGSESGSGGVDKKQLVSEKSSSDDKTTPKEEDKVPRRPPLVSNLDNKKISSLNLHASAPSPKLDPLQVSKPQLSKNLPFSPPINVYDTPTNYLVVVSIPGSDKNSFHVDFHPTSHDLVVKGEIKNKYYDTNSSSDEYVKVSEQRFGSFERNIKFPTLPEVVDDEIKAVYNNGLLEITIPKVVKSKEPKTKRRIEIEEVEDEELLREKQGI